MRRATRRLRGSVLGWWRAAWVVIYGGRVIRLSGARRKRAGDVEQQFRLNERHHPAQRAARGDHADAGGEGGFGGRGRRRGGDTRARGMSASMPAGREPCTDGRELADELKGEGISGELVRPGTMDTRRNEPRCPDADQFALDQAEGCRHHPDSCFRRRQRSRRASTGAWAHRTSTNWPEAFRDRNLRHPA